jgi:MazG family protein
MAAEQGRFNIADSVEAINHKLIRRHPHVFARGDARTAEQVSRRWDEIKAAEREIQGKAKPDGLLGGVPRSLPALMEARQIASRAAGAGFDWENVGGVLEKLREEIAELEAARTGSSQAEVEDEIGDLLFVVVNIARFLKVDPEQALRKTNAKFRRRFSHVEKGVAAAGKTLGDASMEEMEALWQEAKRNGT